MWDGVLPKDEEKKEICAFFRFGIFSLIKKKEKILLTKASSRCHQKVKQMLIILEEMQINSEDAIKDIFYMQKWYSPYDDLINRGKISLIALAYFSFALTALRWQSQILREIWLSSFSSAMMVSFFVIFKPMQLGLESVTLQV